MMGFRVALVALVAACTLLDGSVAAQRAPFVLAGHSVPAGDRADIDVRVPAGATDPSTYIPITVFHGRSNGPVLALTMGVHVIRRSDVHVEVHSGDGAEWLEPFVGIYGGKLASTQYGRSRMIGLAFRFQNVIKYSMDTQEQVDRGRSLNRQAVADGKPTVLVEIGENGRRDAAFVDPIVSGVENLLRVLEMTTGTAAPPRADTQWFDGTASADATMTGIFTPVATRARAVRKGDEIGIVRDYRGQELERVRSPTDGYALYGLAGPPVKAGDSVATIARPAKGPL